MKKILLLVCIPLSLSLSLSLSLPLAAQADVSVDINVPGVSLHLGDQDRRGYYWDGYDWRPPGPRSGGAQCARSVLGRRTLATFAAAWL